MLRSTAVFSTPLISLVRPKKSALMLFSLP
nr:MAG TPA: hypothetical protein [Bacteriophage sp.]